VRGLDCVTGCLLLWGGTLRSGRTAVSLSGLNNGCLETRLLGLRLGSQTETPHPDSPIWLALPSGGRSGQGSKKADGVGSAAPVPCQARFIPALGIVRNSFSIHKIGPSGRAAALARPASQNTAGTSFEPVDDPASRSLHGRFRVRSLNWSRAACSSAREYGSESMTELSLAMARSMSVRAARVRSTHRDRSSVLSAIARVWSSMASAFSSSTA